jgi:hypothetical protein
MTHLTYLTHDKTLWTQAIFGKVLSEQTDQHKKYKRIFGELQKDNERIRTRTDKQRDRRKNCPTAIFGFIKQSG